MSSSLPGERAALIRSAEVAKIIITITTTRGRVVIVPIIQITMMIQMVIDMTIDVAEVQVVRRHLLLEADFPARPLQVAKDLTDGIARHHRQDSAGWRLSLMSEMSCLCFKGMR